MTTQEQMQRDRRMQSILASERMDLSTTTPDEYIAKVNEWGSMDQRDQDFIRSNVKLFIYVSKTQAKVKWITGEVVTVKF